MGYGKVSGVYGHSKRSLWDGRIIAAPVAQVKKITGLPFGTAHQSLRGRDSYRVLRLSAAGDAAIPGLEAGRAVGRDGRGLDGRAAPAVRKPVCSGFGCCGLRCCGSRGGRANSLFFAGAGSL